MAATPNTRSTDKNVAKSPAGATTACQAKKTKKAKPIRKGCRVKSHRKLLCHILEHEEQHKALSGHNDNCNLCGTVKSGNTKIGCVITFDKFPFGFEDVPVRQNKVTVVQGDEEEMECDCSRDDPASRGRKI